MQSMSCLNNNNNIHAQKITSEEKKDNTDISDLFFSVACGNCNSDGPVWPRGPRHVKNTIAGVTQSTAWQIRPIRCMNRHVPPPVAGLYWISINAAIRRRDRSVAMFRPTCAGCNCWLPAVSQRGQCPGFPRRGTLTWVMGHPRNDFML